PLPEPPGQWVDRVASVVIGHRGEQRLSALLTGPLFSLLFRHVHRQMTESTILAAQIRQAIRDLLVLCLPGHPRICGPVEHYAPLLTLPADPRRDVFVDDAFARAERARPRPERERVLQPGPARKRRPREG